MQYSYFPYYSFPPKATIPYPHHQDTSNTHQSTKSAPNSFSKTYSRDTYSSPSSSTRYCRPSWSSSTAHTAKRSAAAGRPGSAATLSGLWCPRRSATDRARLCGMASGSGSRCWGAACLRGTSSRLVAGREEILLGFLTLFHWASHRIGVAAYSSNTGGTSPWSICQRGRTERGGIELGCPLQRSSWWTRRSECTSTCSGSSDRAQHECQCTPAVLFASYYWSSCKSHYQGQWAASGRGTSPRIRRLVRKCSRSWLWGGCVPPIGTIARWNPDRHPSQKLYTRTYCWNPSQTSMLAQHWRKAPAD